MKLINKTGNGKIAFCPDNEIFHVEFGNMFLTLTVEELQRFCEYVYSIDYEYYLNHNKNTFNNRKLMLEIGSDKVMFCLYGSEFLELKETAYPF